MEDNNSIKFYSNFQYRNYLTKYGSDILKNNTNNSLSNQQSNCNYLSLSTPLNISGPYLYKKITDKQQPYGYTESDLKTNFINNQLQQYALDDIRIMNAVEYIYSTPQHYLKTNEINQSS